MQQGAQDYLVKGQVTGDLLVRSMRYAIERQRADNALRQSEERFRVALKSSPIFVYNQDRDLRYTWVYNPPSGLTVEKILGKQDLDIILVEDAQRLIAIKCGVLTTGIGTREEVSYYYQRPPQTGHGELILVVDDEAAIQEITITSLEAHNYKILVASDGIEAIALYAQNRDKISAVLMDIMLPSLDGLTAMRTLQKINPQVRIIASSGLMSDNKLSAVAAIGVNTFLSKPYTVNELLLCLQKVLSDWSLD